MLIPRAIANYLIIIVTRSTRLFAQPPSGYIFYNFRLMVVHSCTKNNDKGREVNSFFCLPHEVDARMSCTYYVQVTAKKWPVFNLKLSLLYQAVIQGEQSRSEQTNTLSKYHTGYLLAHSCEKGTSIFYLSLESWPLQTNTDIMKWTESIFSSSCRRISRLSTGRRRLQWSMPGPGMNRWR